MECMKAEELRIGNLVYVDNDIYHPHLKNVPLTVIGITEVLDCLEETYSISLYDSDSGGCYSYSQLLRFIKPIPLSGAWIIRFGYKDSFLKNNITIAIDKNIFYIHYTERNYFIKTVKYVHDLQNLYFTLTGQELKDE